MRNTFGIAQRRTRPTILIPRPVVIPEVAPQPVEPAPPRERVVPVELFAPIELDPAIREHLTPVKYDGKSDLQGRVNKVNGWNSWTMERRMEFLRQFVQDTAKDPAIAHKTTNILREMHAPVRDHKRQWAALLRWVQRNIYYVNEPNERLQSPQYTLTTKHGDCDDEAILLAALGESIRLPWAFVLSGRNRRTGLKVRWVEGTGPCPKGVEWSHIYLHVGGPPFRPTWWTFAEPTLDVPLGWDNVTSKPVANRADLGTEAVAPTTPGVSGKGAAASFEPLKLPGAVYGKSKEFAGKIPWPTIAGTVIASVLSFVLVQKVVAPRIGVAGAATRKKAKSRSR